jgi:hypothetical protein
MHMFGFQLPCTCYAMNSNAIRIVSPVNLSSMCNQPSDVPACDFKSQAQRHETTWQRFTDALAGACVRV